MSATANRNRIGFEANSANGIWYNSTYTPKLTLYNTNYALWDDPATSTSLALDNLKDAEKDLFPLYRQFHATVKGSPLVSNADLEAMGFPPRESGGGSPHPVDHTFVDLNVLPLGNLVINIAFENRDTGSSVVPYYLTGVVIYYVTSDTPIVNQNQLSFSRLATHSPFELIFDPEQRGQTVYISGRWQNRRGELGPWSDIVSAIIP
jgi:hypothetical protein